MSLVLSSAVDRSLVPLTGEVERFLLLSARAPEGTTRRVPLNLALVVDASGSMNGEKLTRAKEAASYVVHQLSSADRVAIVAYDDNVTVIAPSTLATASAKTNLLYRIARIETGGSTNLAGGWLRGCGEIAQYLQSDNQQSRAIVLTDGLANIGITNPEELAEHARQLRSRGIATSTMGIGVDFNEELLAALAHHGGGRFQYVETAKSIPDCVQGELGEMLAISAGKVVVEVNLPSGARFAECLNDFPIENTKNGVRVHLGDITAGDIRSVVLRLVLNAGAGGPVADIRALAMYLDVESGTGSEGKFPAVTLRTASPSQIEAEQPDQDVAREVALLLAAKAKDEAARLSREGDAVSAVHMLRSAQSTILASSAAAAPMVAHEIAMLGTLADQTGEAPTARQVKEMHYQAYLSRQNRKRYDPPKENS